MSTRPDVLIRIPLAFYRDHASRELPAPPLVEQAGPHGWIDPTHKDFAELVDDARHYAHPHGPDTPNLRTAAKALLRALGL